MSIATSRYKFTGVSQNVVGQSIVLRDSLSYGQFDLLKSKISVQSDLYFGHGMVLKFQHKLHDDQREKCLMRQ